MLHRSSCGRIARREETPLKKLIAWLLSLPWEDLLIAILAGLILRAIGAA